MTPSWRRSVSTGTPPYEEVRQTLGAQGLVFGFGTIQRFFVRHAITRKKRRRTLASRLAPMSSSGGKPGSRGNSTSIPSA